VQGQLDGHNGHNDGLGGTGGAWKSSAAGSPLLGREEKTKALWARLELSLGSDSFFEPYGYRSSAYSIFRMFYPFQPNSNKGGIE
jgi:hypothetical protein